VFVYQELNTDIRGKPIE